MTVVYIKNTYVTSFIKSSMRKPFSPEHFEEPRYVGSYRQFNEKVG